MSFESGKFHAAIFQAKGKRNAIGSEGGSNRCLCAVHLNGESQECAHIWSGFDIHLV